MRRHLLFFCIFLISITTSQLHARIIHVPADQPTIQKGITAAVDGDTAMVTLGTYYEHDVDFIKGFFNLKRRHSARGDLSSATCERWRQSVV